VAYWLAKSEPDVYSIDDLARDGTTGWEGVRNFQARNYLRAMKAGDRVLFYHSNAEPLAVVGVAEVAREAYPDPFQFEKGHAYEDPTSKPEDPRWSTVDLRFVEKLARPVALDRIKADEQLAGMEVARRGSRLSVHPVTAAHFARVLSLGRG
jgi:predicted RNA-binding protein with PUA-like domain